MDEDEILEMEKEKLKIMERYRDEDVGYFPIIIKAA